MAIRERKGVPRQLSHCSLPVYRQRTSSILLLRALHYTVKSAAIQEDQKLQRNAAVARCIRMSRAQPRWQTRLKTAANVVLSLTRCFHDRKSGVMESNHPRLLAT